MVELLFASQLIGAWTLESVETHLETGEIIRAFGDEPKGMIVYTESGHMTAQVSKQDRLSVASNDQQNATDAEIRSNFEGYVAYHGTYEIDEKTNTVTHHVNGSMFKNWEGDDQLRFYSIEGDKVSLSTPEVQWGDLGTVRTVLTWERLEK